MVRIFKVGKKRKRHPILVDGKVNPEAYKFYMEDTLVGEYLFKDHTTTSPSRIKQMQRGNTLSGMSGIGQGGVVGLQKFSYEYDGGNPEYPKAGITHVKL